MAVLNAVEGAFLHWCPGCATSHLVPIGAPYKAHWGFNGDLEKPSFTPSVRHRWGHGAGRQERTCHYFITEGRIEFCLDSSHVLRGQSVPLPEWPLID